MRGLSWQQWGHDYLPFGEELGTSVAGRGSDGSSQDDTIRQKFTSKEHDPESALDYFGARYYGSTMGRFTSPDPDPGSMDITNPQSFNRYAYVLGNPLGNVDPSGMDCVVLDDGTTGDDGQGTPCPGSQTADTINVNGNGPSPIDLYNATFSYGSTYGGSGGVLFSVTATTTVMNPGQRQQPGGNVAQKFACAAKFGQSHSIGALFGGGKVATFLGGNTFSGFVDIGLALSGNGKPPNPTSLALKGNALGVPINDVLTLAGKSTVPELGSAAGFVRRGALRSLFNAATAPGALTSISAEGGEIALQGGITAAQYASGAAVAKFLYDFGTITYGYVFACDHP